jgi:pimeloyl-ACP methyl ester carboxylesterase
MPPQTRYAKAGDVYIAYQVTGDGALDVAFLPGFVSHVEHSWEEPGLARFFQRLGSFARLIRLDKRGTGLSDRVSEIPTLEQRTDDLRAVLDAAGSARPALFGVSEGGPVALLFAATYPERTRALVLYGSYARRAWAPVKGAEILFHAAA